MSGVPFIHDGRGIPTAPYPKDPDHDAWYGVAWDSVVPAGTSFTSQWIVPAGITVADELVDQTDTQDGVTYSRVNKVRLNGGTEGQVYRITNRVTPSGQPPIDRSFDLPVQSL